MAGSIICRKDSMIVQIDTESIFDKYHHSQMLGQNRNTVDNNKHG